MNRREFLRVAAGGVVLLIQTACQSPALGSPSAAARPTNTPQSTLGTLTYPPVPTLPADTLVGTPEATPARLELPLPLEITPIERFFVTSFSDVIPGFDPKLWSLSLDGLVTQPLKFTFDELHALPSVEVMRTLECIGNPVGGGLIANATWRGVSFKELLKQAGVKAAAQYLIIDGADEYFTAVPLELGLADAALLVYEMSGQPLTPQHGRPLRALLPGVYGQKQPKWITHIEVADHYEKGPWERQGWSDTAIIRPNSRIDRPMDEQVIIGKPGDIFTIAGIAFTSSPGVASVQVSPDDGATWYDATLTRAPAPYTNFVWTRWGFHWKLPASGKYTLLARVTDSAGNGQGEPVFLFMHSAFPDGTNAIQQVVVEVRTA